MPNDNHESYNGENISTYSDLITIGNTFTSSQIDACVLSAGILPMDNPAVVTMEHNDVEQQINNKSPYWDNSPNLAYSGVGLDAGGNDWLSYMHIAYCGLSENRICSQMDISKYRNNLSITSNTVNINGENYTYYTFSIQTEYGENNDWNVSGLTPYMVLTDESSNRTGISVETQVNSLWYSWSTSPPSTWGEAKINENATSGRRNLLDNETPDIINKLIYDNILEAFNIENPGQQNVTNGNHRITWTGGNNPFGGKSYINNIDDILMITAICGLKFLYNGTMYKPLVSGGVVYGYTNDMTKTSEWDEWHDIGDHTIPIVPPAPPTPTPNNDDYADMGIGTGGNVGGLCGYAIMSLSDLSDLIGDFNQHLEKGQSVVNNFICCYKLGPISSLLCSTSGHNIIMSAYSTTGNNFVSQRADYKVVSSQKSKVELGSYAVPRMTGTFYDFSPYTNYELFIPCCGWIPLPDIVAGRTITVYLVFDLSTCVCKGVVRIGGTTIAECSGIIGSSVPFYINDSGLARSALVQGVTQTLSSLSMGAVGAATGNQSLAVMGIGNALQSTLSTAIAGNTNYTSVRGGNGDMSAYANGEYCTMKITFPKIEDVANDTMFGHTIGYLCEEVGTLNDFHGFTVVSNPHIKISATSTEKEEIKQLLEQGVILP